MRPRMIVIGGELQNGKDTCADFLKSYFNEKGLSVCKISLATELRHNIEKYFTDLFTSINDRIDGLENAMQFFDSTPWVNKNSISKIYQDLRTTKENIWGDKNFVSRMVHQALGECIRLEVDETFWVRKLLANMDRDADVVIVPDMRWTSDGHYLMDHLKEYDITFIKVVNLNKKGILLTDKDKIRIANNTSENSLYDFKNFSYYLEAGNLEELRQGSLKIAEELLDEDL